MYAGTVNVSDTGPRRPPDALATTTWPCTCARINQCVGCTIILHESFLGDGAATRRDDLI